MRSIFVGMIILSASMVVAYPAEAQNNRRVHAAHVQKHPQGRATYGYVPPPLGRQLPTNVDLKAIRKENEENNRPVPRASEDDALTKKIEQDNARLDRLINGICPACGLGGAAP